MSTRGTRMGILGTRMGTLGTQRRENPRASESDPEQHSRYLVAGARKLGIDLRANGNLKRWLNQAGFISYKEESFAWCTSYSGGG